MAAASPRNGGCASAAVVLRSLEAAPLVGGGAKAAARSLEAAPLVGGGAKAAALDRFERSNAATGIGALGNARPLP